MEEGSVVTAGTAHLLRFLRKRIKHYIDKHNYETALFWADKVDTLSNGDLSDTIVLCQCLFYTHQYHRAAHILQSRKLDEANAACKYLTAKCFFEAKEYVTALKILSPEYNKKPSNQSINMLEECISPTHNIDSSICLLRGYIHEAMDNSVLASDCFREALKIDSYCYEAFEALIKHQMLDFEEERTLLKSISSNKLNQVESEFVKSLYQTKLTKYSKPEFLEMPDELKSLQQNLDLQVVKAERLYYNCDYRQCFGLTTQILEKDPYHTDCLPLHVVCLVELKQSNDLFQLAHKLVDLYPDKALSWFAVGCYYHLIGRNEPARRYLNKATSLDKVFGPAWLAYGHAFAVENEHDQAIAAYFKAAQLMKGCHLPVLYVGLEYGVTNNPKLADRFFSQALSIAPEDPFVLHEIGVVAFQNKDYGVAEKYFLEALSHVCKTGHSVSPSKWEPLLNNLGHASRKLKKYDEALSYHQQALVMSPLNPSTYSAMGYVHALQGHPMEAIECFHKALGLRREDSFTTTILSSVIELVKECNNSLEDVTPPDIDVEMLLKNGSETTPADVMKIPDKTVSIEVDMDMESM